MGKRIMPRAALCAAIVAVVPALSACGGVKDPQPDVVAGKQMFVQKCGACHTLAHANTKGTQGPDLDDAFQQSLKEGFGESAVRGVIFKQILYPNRLKNSMGIKMPAKLVAGQDAHDVAAYVASVVGKPGRDTGRLGSAVRTAGGGSTTEKNGVVSIPADPTGQLAFVYSKATATAGDVTVAMPNRSGTTHDIVIDGLGRGAQVSKGISSFKARLEAGKTYTYYCSVPGHRQAGMQGTLTVR
jgi:mono/diheme cytochrome c family protein